MTELNDAGEVRAAGGVVSRERGTGVEVLLVHRPHYDDWTFPKGKVEAGETDEQCAVREVEEETGYRCELGAELRSIRWVDRFGRPKVARYWAMAVVAGDFVPHDEVDEVRWVSIDAARELLTYERDIELLDHLR